MPRSITVYAAYRLRSILSQAYWLLSHFHGALYGYRLLKWNIRAAHFTLFNDTASMPLLPYASWMRTIRRHFYYIHTKRYLHDDDDIRWEASREEMRWATYFMLMYHRWYTRWWLRQVIGSFGIIDDRAWCYRENITFERRGFILLAIRLSSISVPDYYVTPRIYMFMKNSRCWHASWHFEMLLRADPLLQRARPAT